jgi:hypothetical protein
MVRLQAWGLPPWLGPTELVNRTFGDEAVQPRSDVAALRGANTAARPKNAGLQPFPAELDRI